MTEIEGGVHKSPALIPSPSNCIYLNMDVNNAHILYVSTDVKQAQITRFALFLFATSEDFFSSITFMFICHFSIILASEQRLLYLTHLNIH